MPGTAPLPESVRDLAQEFDRFRERFDALRRHVGVAIVGHKELLRDVLVAVFSHGHVLLEGVPGLGKTYVVRVLSRVLGLRFGRVQCTPDLMPSDILGTHVVADDGQGGKRFVFQRGPVFTNLLLVDEVNRATPKTQAALLEVMQEECVTVGGESFPLERPFFVLATQNPLEMEGTYPLPEAQLDRFLFKLRVTFPNEAELVEISRRTTGEEEPALEVALEGEELVRLQRVLTRVPVAEPLAAYAAALILATHPDSDRAPPKVKRYVAYGASPRGMQALVRAARAHCLLDGRTAVSVADLRAAALPALRHRVLLNFEGEAEAVDADALVREVLAHVPAPAGAER
jgi:MoxR-like ATPase